MKQTMHPLRFSRLLIHSAVILGCLFFALWLMLSTLSYNPDTHTILIATRLWSDFGAHIPLVRSFSLGDNLDRLFGGKMPEYPLFPGEPIRYHFLFFALAGWLERTGVRIDWAINIPSIFGFFLLSSLIYVFATKVFDDVRVGILSLLFFLLNGSLSFIRFFDKHPLSLRTLTDILRANEFPSFAPWGPGDISAFWNMNIYTNQRHLAFAFGIALAFIIMLLWVSKKPLKKQLPWAVVWGCIIGVLPFFHQPTLVIIALFAAVYLFLFPEVRLFLVSAGFIAGVLIFLQLPVLPHDGNQIMYYPGYLIHDLFTQNLPVWEKVLRFGWYWFENLGGHLILAPLGYIFVSKWIKKVFAPLIFLFLIPNLFKFSVEVAASHKFFNFFLIMSSMLSAYAVIHMFDFLNRKKHLVFHLFAYFSTCFFVVFLTLSGIIDLAVVANDHVGTLPDIQANPVAGWIQQNTPPDAVFLNTSWMYNPASLAGRKITLGWPYFAWSAGYNTDQRLNDMKTILEAGSVPAVCPGMQSLHVTHIMTEEPQSDLTVNNEFFNTYFPLLYRGQSGSTTYSIYSGTPTCSL